MDKFLIKDKRKQKEFFYSIEMLSEKFSRKDIIFCKYFHISYKKQSVCRASLLCNCIYLIHGAKIVHDF